MSLAFEKYIKTLNMQKHVEGGYYAQSYVSQTQHDETRALWSSIYFMLCEGEVSHFHRLTADEMWYYHAGESLTIYMISPDGKLTSVQLGLDVEAGEVPQFLVPKGCIFGSAMNQAGFSLVGCMVSPGFTFEDFELFSQEYLLETYPEHEALIKRLSRSEKSAF